MKDFKLDEKDYDIEDENMGEDGASIEDEIKKQRGGYSIEDEIKN